MSKLILASDNGFTPHSYAETLRGFSCLYWHTKPATTIAIAKSAARITNIAKHTSSFTYYLPSKNILLKNFLI